jgi:hypothetical protein
MATASKSIPFIVSPQSVPAEPITQQELTTFLSLRGRLSQLESQVEEAEQSIKSRLEAGATLEPGDHVAELKESFRRNVAWKEVAVRLANKLYYGKGAGYVAGILHRTKPVRAISVEVR